MEEYIKYSYEVEEIPENFDEYITTINNDIREYIKNTPNLSRATFIPEMRTPMAMQC